MSDLPQLRIYGRNLTEAQTRATGEAFAELLHEIGLSMGFDQSWTVPRVDFMCDGCGFRQPFDAKRIAWTHREGDDFCAACSCVTNLRIAHT